MGSTPAHSQQATPKPAVQVLPPTPAPAPTPPVEMDVDMPDTLGCDEDIAGAICLRGTADYVEEDFDAAHRSIAKITDLVNWTMSQSRVIAPSLADQCCEDLLSLVHSMSELGMLKGFVDRDNEINVRHSVVGNIVSSLVSVPGIAAFTPAPEDIQRAKAPKKGPKAPTGKGPKTGKAKAPPVPPPPPPIPHATRPIRPLPAKLAAARAEVGMSNVWVPVTNKRKSGLPQEEVLVRMARNFPASTTIALQQASAAVTGRTKQQTASEARRVKQKRSTTQGRTRKSISVYSIPPFPWKEDEIFGQINGHLGNAKRSLRVTGVESGRGGLSLLTV